MRASPQREPLDRPGQMLGDWRLLRLIGQGAFSDVFEAEGRSGERSAIRLAIDSSPATWSAFAASSAYLRYVSAEPALVGTHIGWLGALEYQGRSGQVLELAKGDLARHLRCPIGLLDRLFLVHRLSSHIARCHACGVVHGDVKRANVLLRTHRHPCLGDPGRARPVPTSVAHSLVSVPGGHSTNWVYLAAHGLTLPCAETVALSHLVRGVLDPGRSGPWNPVADRPQGIARLLQAGLEGRFEDAGAFLRAIECLPAFQALQTGARVIDGRPWIDGSTWRLIPGGSWTVGASDGPSWSDGPRRSVEFPPFFVTDGPISMAQYRAYRSDTGRPGIEEGRLQHLPDDAPAKGLSWIEAAGYAAWCGARLPDELELEVAIAVVPGLRACRLWAGNDYIPELLHHPDPRSLVRRSTPGGPKAVRGGARQPAAARWALDPQGAAPDVAFVCVIDLHPSCLDDSA